MGRPPSCRWWALKIGTIVYCYLSLTNRTQYQCQRKHYSYQLGHFEAIEKCHLGRCHTGQLLMYSGADYWADCIVCWHHIYNRPYWYGCGFSMILKKAVCGMILWKSKKGPTCRTMLPDRINAMWSFILTSLQHKLPNLCIEYLSTT